MFQIVTTPNRWRKPSLWAETPSSYLSAQIFISIEMCLKEQLALCSKFSNGGHGASHCPSPTLLKSIHTRPKRSSNFPSEMTISSLGTISWSRLLSNKWLLVMFADAQGPLTSSSWDGAQSLKLVSLWSSTRYRQMPLNWLTKAI